MIHPLNLTLALIASGFFLLAPAALRADNCRDDYNKKIQLIEQELGSEYKQMREDYSRLAKELNALPAKDERRLDLQKQIKTLKASLTQVKQAMQQRRKEASDAYQECKKQKDEAQAESRTKSEEARAKYKQELRRKQKEKEQNAE